MSNKIRDMNNTITLLVIMTIKPEHLDEATKLIKRLKKTTRKEVGCKSYVVKRDENDINTFVFIEKFYDRDGLMAHKNSKHAQEILYKLLPPMVSEKVVKYLR